MDWTPVQVEAARKLEVALHDYIAAHGEGGDFHIAAFVVSAHLWSDDIEEGHSRYYQAYSPDLPMHEALGLLTVLSNALHTTLD